MKKLLILVWTISSVIFTYGQSNDSGLRLPDRFIRSSMENYKKDLVEYEKLSINEISEPSTFYNYYLTVLHANFYNQNNVLVKAKLQNIYELLTRLNPGCFESKFINYFRNKNTSEGLESLKEAFNMEPDNMDTWDDMMAYYEIFDDGIKARELAKKIKNAGKYDQEIYRYQRNVIASTLENAVIFTNGELDTYPLLVLLLTENKSRTIKVINYNLLNHNNYKARVLEEIGCSQNINPLNVSSFMESLEKEHLNINLYVSLTFQKSKLRSLQDRLYLTGLVFQYSSTKIDNVKFCVNHFNNDFDMNYLRNKKLLRPEVKDLNRNYLPMLKLIQQHASDESREQNKKIETLISHLKR